jgi:hypothetical protein
VAKNELAQKEFCFRKTLVMMKAAAITSCPPPLYHRCTGSKDGKFQGGLLEQKNAVECVD